MINVHAKLRNFASYTLRLMTWNVNNGSLVSRLAYL